MALQLNTGLGGGFALGTWPGTAGTNANASPQGPANAAEAGFGTTASAGEGGRSGRTTGFLSVATISFGVLVWIWWSLPR